jgi:hypothetical protein
MYQSRTTVPCNILFGCPIARCLLPVARLLQEVFCRGLKCELDPEGLLYKASHPPISRFRLTNRTRRKRSEILKITWLTLVHLILV